MSKERIRHDRSAGGIEKALENLAANKPELENVVKAFGPLLLAKAAFKEECPLPESVKEESFDFDSAGFAQGEPLFASIGMIDFQDDFEGVIPRLLPPMKTAFVGIREDLEKMEKGFSDHVIDTRECVRAFMNDQQEILEKQAGQMGASIQVFQFVLGQLVKPFMEMQAEVFAPLTEGQQWLHGYCPVCGSHAAVAGLAGEGGKRWLQCANCSHEWRFNRHTCPRCSDNDHTKHEYFFDRNSPVKAGERVDVCKECRSYLLTIDLRERIDPVNMDVAAMGMIPLDMLAQQKGYAPLASTPWNALK
ncbi:MAG: formate dehydrogenase accessory protein FdhE [Desulfobacteraceae bacterium]|nr:formate dehydrogenase accessory protein FdhE [Desulfobacteraceae bacterium]